MKAKMKVLSNPLILIYGIISSLALILICITDVVGGQVVTNQTTLKIAVPPKAGFNGLVKIDRDPRTDKAVNFSGFAIEVFRQAFAAAVDKSITFEFIAYEKPDGTMNGTYDDMVQAVFRQEYDCAVGDVSIRYERTQWVDFTIPFTDTGVSILIPLRQQVTKSTLPMTKGVVIAALVILFFSPMVYVIMEIVNFIRKPSQRPVDQQLGVAHVQELKDEMLKVIKGASLVLLLWFLVLVFLNTCHAANLTSLLTKEQARTPTKSLNQLIRTGEKVGYYQGSFIANFLKNYGLMESQLLPYNSETELGDMMSKGSKGGGIDVAIDETTNLNIFMAQNCNQYAIVPVPNIHDFGYGYAFNKKYQRLVLDVSIGIAKLFDNGQLEKIRAKTIGSGTCDIEQDVGPNDDGGDTFMGNHISKFLLAGAIISVIFVVITYFLHYYSFYRR